MQLLLVKLASIAVMIHMTLGCNWHHGLGVQACIGQCSTTSCSHDNKAENVECSGNHQHGDHNHNLPILSLTAGDDLCECDGHSHFGCQDDGCNATKVIKFVFWPAESSSPMLCEAENSALVASLATACHAIDPFPDYSHTATSLRAHLILGVLII